MKKLFLFILFVLTTSMLFGAYNIKLGVFKNIKNLRVNIAKVKPYTFRKQVLVKKKKNLYYTYAVIEGSSTQSKKALKAYQRIFKDAFISGKVEVKRKKIEKKSQRIKKKKVLKKKVPMKKTSKQKEPRTKLLIKKVPKVITPIIENIKALKITKSSEINSTVKESNILIESHEEVLQKSQLDIVVEDANNTHTNIFKVPVTQIETIEKTVEIIDVKEVLLLKSIYLCYEEGPAHLEQRVVRMTFNKDTISYNTLEEELQLDIAYKIEKNKILLTLMDTYMVHKIVHHKEDYLSVESYVKDKKMHTLRYYFSESLALKYVKGH